MEKHKIKSYIKQIRGVSYKPDDLCDVLDNSSVILLRANNIEDGIINFDSIQYVSKSKVSSEQYLKKGDILILNVLLVHFVRLLDQKMDIVSI